MKSTAEKVEKNKVRIEIQVDAQDFEKAMNKSYMKNKENSIPVLEREKLHVLS